MVDAGMFGQRLSGLCAQAGDDVQRTGRKADLGGQRRDPQQGQASVFRRLDDAGIARRQGRTHRSPEDLHRIVPGNDVGGDAVWLADRQNRVALLVGNRLAVQFVGRAAIELEIARQCQHIRTRLLERLAGVG